MAVAEPVTPVQFARFRYRRVGGTAGLAAAVLLGVGPAVPAGTGTDPFPIVTLLSDDMATSRTYLLFLEARTPDGSLIYVEEFVLPDEIGQ